MAEVLFSMGLYYRNIRKRAEDASYKAYFTYLNYDQRIQSMIYTTNWIERLQKDFRMGPADALRNAERGVCSRTNNKSIHR